MNNFFTNNTTSFYSGWGTTSGNGTEAMDTSENCIHRKDPTVLILSIIPIVALLLNSLVFVAVILHRSKLKQNNVYIYVYSTLGANLLFSILCVYQVFNHYFQFEGDPAASFTLVRGWWVFRKALVVAMYLVMIGNIGTLIYAIRAGNYVVAKAASAHNLGDIKSSVTSLQTKRKRAFLFIAGVWIIPILLALITLSGWNCSEVCTCLSGCYYLSKMEQNNSPCSRILTPLANSYMAVVVIVWCFENAILFIMICKTLGKSIILSTDCFRTRNKISAKADSENVPDLSVGRYQNSPTENEHRPEAERVGDSSPAQDAAEGNRGVRIPISNEDGRCSEIETRTRRADRRRRRYAKWLRIASKQLSYLTVLFFLCTAPAMICIVVDITRREMVPSMVSSTLISLPLLYSIVSPVILARDLAGLKSALISLVLRILPGTRTEHHLGTGTYSSSTLSDLEKKKLKRRSTSQ